MRGSIFAGCLFAPLLLASAALAQKPVPAFPRDAAAWLNSAPINEETLKGKAALLYFYEEGCPRCAERWPEVLAVANQFQGKPIAFIAVNSGTPRASVAGYVRRHGITWPTIVDADRSFEARCGVPEVSLENIWQVRLVTAGGELTVGNSQALEMTATRAVEGAKWNIDPAEMPAALLPAWTAVEFGNYPAASAPLQRYLKARKPEEKEAAEKLQAYVDQKLQEQLQLAEAAFDDGRKWEAYKGYSEVQRGFRGFDVPDEVDTKVKSLQSDDAVKTELAALKRFQAVSKAIASAKTPAARERGLKLLERIVDDLPDTEAAAQAKALLADLSGSAAP
jgi:peroxiredoxin